MAALSSSIIVPPISDLHQHRPYAQFFPRIPQQFPVVSSHLIAQATRRTSNSHQESDALSNESRSWGRIEFDDDEDDEDDDEEEEDRSIDLLLRFIENVFRKVSRRARKAVRSVLPPAISTKLVGFSVNGAILLAFLWVLKAFLEAAMATQQRGFCLTSSILVIFALSAVASVYSQSTVVTLPGFSGELPFKLETGYIGVGEFDEIQLFYYFIESERELVTDPLMLWLAGGPGCSGLSSILFEIGPLKIDVEAWNGSLPSLLLNPYSWTKVANILFIDQPVGTGFSYAISQSAYNTSDTLSVDQVYTFLRKWIAYHPRFISNPLYIGGNSYSGITVPILVQKILDGLEDKLQPEFNLQGYVLGNPLTDYYIDENSRIPFVHRVSLISDGLYQNATVHCNGDYVNLDFDKPLCITSMQTITTCLLQINLVQILEPQCAFSSKRRKEIVWDFRVEEAKATEFLLLATKLSPHSKLPELRCRSFGYMLSRKWANDVGVREALHVRQGTVSSWMRCAKSLPYYTKDVSSTIAYHRNLSTTGLRALIFSGDHDISVPYIGTLKWIKSLGVPVSDHWRAWYVDGQVAGYAMEFINDEYHLAYATLKGSGNAAPEYTPNPALAMVGRFFAYYPL